MAARLDEQDACGARSEAERLQSDTIAAVNAGRIPRPFQEELLGSVNALLEAIECVPPPPPTVEDDEDEDDEGRGEKKGQGKKKGKGKD